MSQTIGVIGSGTVGQTLAAGFVKHGYSVTMGTRDASKLADFLKANPAVKTGSVEDAAKFGQIIVLATAGCNGAPEAALKSAGEANIKGKLIIDVTNPCLYPPQVESYPPKDGVFMFEQFAEGSLMAHLQAKFPDVHFVKAWNSVGTPCFVNPVFKDPATRPTMFICGNDEASKKIVAVILDKFGWDSKDMGTAVSAVAVEALCQLWCVLGYRNNQWTHAFKLLEK